jgi:hypothetical protein
MRHCNSIFASLLKPIPRRWFKATVERHGGDAYDKSFRSWDHLVMLTFAQLCGVDSLRGLEAVWNAHSHHHYHLGTGPVARSTLSDANARRPVAIFAETFAMLSGLADHALKREGIEMLRLIDSTPIPLDEIVSWAEWNGRTRGLKLHVVYDPAADHPRRIEITPSTVNDVQVGKAMPIEAGDLCLRQGLLQLRLVDADSPGPQHLRHTLENQRHLQACLPARAQGKKGRWLYGPRRRRGQTRNSRPCQARHPDAARAPEARQWHGPHPHHQ